MVILRFVTRNQHKVKEASSILSQYGIGIIMENAINKVEIQSDSLEEIVTYALRLNCVNWLVVEDDGLFVDSLNGFPGPYSEYVYRTIGLRGLLRLLQGSVNRSAYFKSVVGLCINNEVKLFTGIVKGRLSEEPRGSGGFGYDPVFIPDGYDLTFSEMGEELKNKLSHRSRAFNNLAGYLTRITDLGQGA
ncbi:XTP/dITP diphosphatase [Caldivirga sp.]|uniref:XTP/dITP diphosphatase n=1 Tax=Caldivirga sp. TaxID=2080243 RepID=UPI0025C4B981|nr:XTP/dITP diphosphatase [Caldivirga sp.]